MKIISFIFGLVLIGVIIYFGFYTSTNPTFGIWFGVITAILAPLSFELLFTPFKSKDKTVLKELSKVPQIEKLIKEANDNESKIKLLEQQRIELDKLISFESRRRTLIAERNIYVLQGEVVLKNLTEINENLELLTSELQALPVTLQLLQKEIKKYGFNDIILTLFGKKYIFKKSNFDTFPIYGQLFFMLIKEFAKLDNIIKSKNSR
jgi:hypothetical protein